MRNSRSCLDCGRAGVLARNLCRSCYYKRKYHGLELPPKVVRSFEEHAARAIVLPSGCRLWPAGVTANGYGYCQTHTLAHVAAYERVVGPVPDGLDIGHACHDADLWCPDGLFCLHRRCINPQHLVAQTRSENLLARPGRQEFCKRNHRLAGANVYVIPSTGSRQCMVCAGRRPLAA